MGAGRRDETGAPAAVAMNAVNGTDASRADCDPATGNDDRTRRRRPRGDPDPPEAPRS